MAEAAPTVSVIIIFLDPSGAYLGEAIESVRAQSLENWELILVDDGSSDDSTAVARGYASAEPGRIRYLEHPGHANQGMSASRNLGIAAAQGRHLAFLDADDVWLPERLAHHVAILEAQPEVAMVYGPTLYWFSWRPQATADDWVGPLGLTAEHAYGPPRILQAFLDTQGAIVPGICSLTVRRAAALAVGAFEPEFRGCYEDQVFIHKICAHHRVFVTARPLDRYRQHSASCTAQAKQTGEYLDERPHPSRERFLRWLKDYLEHHAMIDGALERGLARELWPYEHPKLHRLFVLPLIAAKPALKRLKRWLCGRLSEWLPA
jgi:glycosyltransferase involved in cell wall biosynthesis